MHEKLFLVIFDCVFISFEKRQLEYDFDIFLFSILKVLHLFWGFFVGRVVYSSLVEGKVRIL